MVIGLSEVQLSNRASNFKSAERVARVRFEIISTISPELYDTKSSYQLIVSITKCEVRKTTCPSGIYFKLSVLQAVEKQL